MKRLYLIFALLLLTVLLFSQDPIAVMIKSKGNISLIRNSKEKPITSGEQLYNGDILKSGKKSYAAIKFSDASSMVKLFPSSQIVITAKKNKGKYDKKINLKVGDIWSKVTKKTGKYDIETPTTVVSVKGTEFLVGFDTKKMMTSIMTFKGVVLVKNKSDKFIKEVHPGEKTFSFGKGIMGIKKFKPSDLNEDMLNFIQDDKNIFEFDIQKENGEKKHIKMDFE